MKEDNQLNMSWINDLSEILSEHQVEPPIEVWDGIEKILPKLIAESQFDQLLKQEFDQDLIHPPAEIFTQIASKLSTKLFIQTAFLKPLIAILGTTGVAIGLVFMLSENHQTTIENQAALENAQGNHQPPIVTDKPKDLIDTNAISIEFASDSRESESKIESKVPVGSQYETIAGLHGSQVDPNENESTISKAGNEQTDHDHTNNLSFNFNKVKSVYCWYEKIKIPRDNNTPFRGSLKLISNGQLLKEWKFSNSMETLILHDTGTFHWIWIYNDNQIHQQDVKIKGKELHEMEILNLGPALYEVEVLPAKGWTWSAWEIKTEVGFKQFNINQRRKKFFDEKPTVHDVRALLQDENGCVDTIYTQIENYSLVKIEQPTIPNVISLSSTMGNNVLRPIIPACTHLELYVFNSKKEMIFESKECDSFWDGREKSGVTCNPGTYILLLRYKQADENLKVITQQITILP